MKLTVGERIQLQQILPAKGNIVNLRILEDLRKKLSFTEKEIKEYKVKQVEGTNSITWNNKGTVPKEIEIGDQAKEIIVKELKALSDKEQLTLQYISIYDKFIKPEESKQ